MGLLSTSSAARLKTLIRLSNHYQNRLEIRIFGEVPAMLEMKKR
jgi:hypothetical protein